MTNMIALILLCLNWDPSPGAEGYRLYHNSSRSFNFVGFADVKDVGKRTEICVEVQPNSYEWFAYEAYQGTNTSPRSHLIVVICPRP